VPIFFHRDERAEFMNAIAVSFIHRENWKQLEHLPWNQYVRHRTSWEDGGITCGTSGALREGSFR
jgi:hypothetical protein